MSKARILLILGVWLVVLPYLGFPYAWKDLLGIASGLGLVFFSYLLYREAKTKEVKKEKVFENFSENKFLGGESGEQP